MHWQLYCEYHKVILEGGKNKMDRTDGAVVKMGKYKSGGTHVDPICGLHHLCECHDTTHVSK